MKSSDSEKIILRLIVIISAIYIIKLFKIQIFTQEYKKLAKSNFVKVIQLKALRGIIVDRKGQIIVSNAPRYKIQIEKEELAKKNEEGNFSTLFDAGSLNTKDTKNRKSRKEYIERVFSREEWIKFQENLYDCKQFHLEIKFEREYVRPILSHVLGYIGEISEIEIKKDKEEKIYSFGDYLGKSGIEKQYEKILRGKKGIAYVVVDVNGNCHGEYSHGSLNVASKPGSSIVLTIDADLQEYGESLMKNKIGSIVAIEPATGEVLCLISSPSYDPNLLVGEGLRKNYIKLLRDGFKPLFNRAIAARYAPGSIFKMGQAMVAQEMNVVDKNTQFPCDKNYIKCHAHPNNLNLREAIAHSCNPYFGFLFRRIINRGRSPNKFIDSKIGLDEWCEKIKKFGFGKKLGIDLPEEVAGMIPDSKYYDKIYGKLSWKQSTIRSLDIGQGESLITPLQMCNMAVVIANRGYYIRPHLLKSIEGQEKKEEKEKFFLNYNNIDYEFFVECMHEATLYGTAKRAKVPDVDVCAKTGTTQNNQGSGKDHSVCIAFAPKNQPTIVVSVYVENAGWGGQAAAAIAGLMIEKYLFGEIKRKAMEEYAMRDKFD